MITIGPATLRAIQSHAESAFPNEGAGFMLGLTENSGVTVTGILPLPNSREAEAQRNRYLITEQDYLRGEQEAARQGLDLVGVFHSHPDHPAQPSIFDRDYAMPNFSYVITSVQAGKAVDSRSWRLRDDRIAFDEERLLINQENL